MKKKSRKLNKKKSRKFSKKKSRRGTRFKRVMRGGERDRASYGLMKSSGNISSGTVSNDVRSIILDADMNRICLNNGTVEKGFLDISNLTKLKKTDNNTLDIESEAGNLRLKIVNVKNIAQKDTLYSLYMRLLLLKLNQKQNNGKLNQDDIHELSGSIPKSGDIGHQPYNEEIYLSALEKFKQQLSQQKNKYPGSLLSTNV